MQWPLDNAGALIKELVYESGAKWVLHGSPAGGSGVYGAMELGAVVLAVGRSEEHISALMPVLKVRKG